jgi:hypothetical protein
MTVTIPHDLEQAVLLRARERCIDPDELVREALTWYVQMDADVADELTAWQEVRDEALRLVEESEP